MLKNLHYQPIVKNKKYWEEIRKGNYKIPEGWFLGGERNCVDRLSIIVENMPKGGTTLDIGCNIGFFSHSLAALGYKATGIENDVHVNVKKFTKKSSIETGKSLNKKYGLDVEFLNADFIDYLKKHDRSWDYTLFLSVFHHLFIGYGYSDQNKLSPAEAVGVLQLVAKRTNKIMFFEMDEVVGEDFGWGKEDVEKNLRMYTDFDVIEKLTESKDGWKAPRTVYRCSRSEKSKKGEFGRLINLSESRHNKVGCIKNGHLFMSREAPDWGEGHLYNAPVIRSKTVKDDKIFEILKNNPHPNIAKIYGYDKDWIEMEYVEGVLLSADTPFLFEEPKERDYISKGFGVEALFAMIGQAKEGLDHLHKIGLCHTDLTTFNAIVEKNGNLKIIDLTGCVPKTKKMEDLDSEVFVRYFIGSLIQSFPYKYINQESDRKMKYSLLSKEKAFGELKEEMTEKNTRVEQLEGELAAKESELEKIYNSKSWKMLKFYKKIKPKRS